MAKLKGRFTVESYKALEARCRRHFLEGLLARWEFGAHLLEERKAHGGNQLPHGRLDELCKTCKLSRSEIQNRMQFAEEYPTREEVPKALGTFGPWYKIVARGLGRRQKEKRWASELDHLLFDLENVPATPRALGELVPYMTPEQIDRAWQGSLNAGHEFDAFRHKMTEVVRGRKPRAA